MSTPQTEAITRIRQAARQRYGAAWVESHDLGVFNCRQIRDTAGNYGDSWSQHAWGNAWDVAVTGGAQTRFVQWLESASAGLSSLPVARILRYDDHVHVEGDPVKTGTPPCASGDEPDETRPDDDAALTPDDPGGYDPDDPPPDWRDALDALAAVGDPDTWRRFGLGVLGIVLVAVGIVLMGGEAVIGRLGGRT